MDKASVQSLGTSEANASLNCHTQAPPTRWSARAIGLLRRFQSHRRGSTVAPIRGARAAVCLAARAPFSLTHQPTSPGLVALAGFSGPADNGSPARLRAESWSPPTSAARPQQRRAALSPRLGLIDPSRGCVQQAVGQPAAVFAAGNGIFLPTPFQSNPHEHGKRGVHGTLARTLRRRAAHGVDQVEQVLKPVNPLRRQRWRRSD